MKRLGKATRSEMLGTHETKAVGDEKKNICQAGKLNGHEFNLSNQETKVIGYEKGQYEKSTPTNTGEQVVWKWNPTKTNYGN